MNVKIKLSKDVQELLERAYAALYRGEPHDALATRVEFVLRKLLEQWDLANDEITPIQEKPLSGNVNEALRQITQPDVSLPLKVREGSMTPVATDGLVPWDYIASNYANIDYIAKLKKDYTDEGEHAVHTVRQLFSRIPEDQWESEQTRSLVVKALTRPA